MGRDYRGGFQKYYEKIYWRKVIAIYIMRIREFNKKEQKLTEKTGKVVLVFFIDNCEDINIFLKVY